MVLDLHRSRSSDVARNIQSVIAERLDNSGIADRTENRAVALQHGAASQINRSNLERAVGEAERAGAHRQRICLNSARVDGDRISATGGDDRGDGGAWHAVAPVGGVVPIAVGRG